MYERPPSRDDPEAGCSPPTAISPECATSPSRAGNHGLYATPRSIYGVLDRNNLMALMRRYQVEAARTSCLPAAIAHGIVAVHRSRSPGDSHRMFLTAIESQPCIPAM